MPTKFLLKSRYPLWSHIHYEVIQKCHPTIAPCMSSIDYHIRGTILFIRLEFRFVSTRPLKVTHYFQIGTDLCGLRDWYLMGRRISTIGDKSISSFFVLYFICLYFILTRTTVHRWDVYRNTYWDTSAENAWGTKAFSADDSEKDYEYNFYNFQFCYSSLKLQNVEMFSDKKQYFPNHTL